MTVPLSIFSTLAVSRIPALLIAIFSSWLARSIAVFQHERILQAIFTLTLIALCTIAASSSLYRLVAFVYRASDFVVMYHPTFALSIGLFLANQLYAKSQDHP